MTLHPAPGGHWLRPPAEGRLGPTAHCSDRHSSAVCQRVLGRGSRSARGRCIFVGGCDLQGQGGSLHASLRALLGTAQGVQRETPPLAGPGWEQHRESSGRHYPWRGPDGAATAGPGTAQHPGQRPRFSSSSPWAGTLGCSRFRLKPGVNLSLTRVLDVASMVWGRRVPHPARGPLYEGTLVWQRSAVMGSATWNL